VEVWRPTVGNLKTQAVDADRPTEAWARRCRRSIVAHASTSKRSVAELLPVTRFRGPGRYTLTLRATDKSGLTSLPARRTFSHG